MKTSLVMATYNGEKYLHEQLESIYNQTVSIDEVIIIDDLSTDHSVEVVSDFISKHNLNWKLIKNEKNLGYRLNFRKGLTLVNNDIVFLCDQDDRWHLDKVETMLKYMENPEVLTLASSFEFMNQDGNIFKIKQQKGKTNNNLLQLKVKDELTSVPLKNLLRMNFSQGCAMAIKKSMIEEFLKQSNDELPHDWQFNMMSATHQGCYYLDVPLIDYRIHDNNTIGLDEIMDDNRQEIMKKRVNQRVELIGMEVVTAKYALKQLVLNEEQRQMCQRFYKYLNQRIQYMKEKKLLRLAMFYITGKYSEFGTFKTFAGDLINILK